MAVCCVACVAPAAGYAVYGVLCPLVVSFFQVKLGKNGKSNPVLNQATKSSKSGRPSCFFYF